MMGQPHDLRVYSATRTIDERAYVASILGPRKPSPVVREQIEKVLQRALDRKEETLKEDMVRGE